MNLTPSPSDVVDLLAPIRVIEPAAARLDWMAIAFIGVGIAACMGAAWFTLVRYRARRCAMDPLDRAFDAVCRSIQLRRADRMTLVNACAKAGVPPMIALVAGTGASDVLAASAKGVALTPRVRSLLVQACEAAVQSQREAIMASARPSLKHPPSTHPA